MKFVLIPVTFIGSLTVGIIQGPLSMHLIILPRSFVSPTVFKKEYTKTISTSTDHFTFIFCSIWVRYSFLLTDSQTKCIIFPHIDAHTFVHVLTPHILWVLQITLKPLRRFKTLVVGRCSRSKILSIIDIGSSGCGEFWLDYIIEIVQIIWIKWHYWWIIGRLESSKFCI